ncbi:MAG TPA: CATRA conflict system CASPASE/TPR repeat-associated protein [Actinoplanes sp.]
MTLLAPALHVHTYLDPAHHHETMTALEKKCLALGMTSLSEDASVRPGGPWPRWLRSSPAADRVYQALRYDNARLSAVLVCLAPAGADAGWADLDREWPDAGGDGYVGRVRLFYALYEGDGDEARLAKEVRTALPGVPALVLSALVSAVDGIFLWETANSPADRADRVLVLLAPASAEAAADALLWPSGNAVLPPLPGYLWQMAIVRHEARRFAERRAVSPPGALHDLAARFEAAERAGFPSAGERDRLLDTLQRRTALAAAGEAVLRTVRRTIDAAAANAGSFMTLSAADRDYTTWLLTEVDDAIGGQHDAVAYAEPLARVGLAETEKRLRDLGARSEWLTLLQTSVIAAAGLALAASQTLNYDWPTYRSLETPFIVAVTLLGLALPLGTAALSPLARRRLVVAAAIAAAGLGAALGWLACTWLARAHSRPPGHEKTLPAAAVLAAIAVAVGWGLRKRRDHN